MNGEILEWLRKEYASIRSGQASPSVLDTVKVEVYGTPTPISQLATITISDPRTIRITPWDKSVIAAIDAAIRQGNLGVSVAVDGEGVRVSFPQLTADSRQTLLKLAKQKLEEARIKVRNGRQKVLDDIAKEDAGEDVEKRKKNELQKSVDDMNKKLEESYERKQTELAQ